MPVSNIRVATSGQIRELEKLWIERMSKITAMNWGQVLMEAAGRVTALSALSLWNENPGHVSILCGRGNNGGDGLVIARFLSLWDIPVSAFIFSEDGQETMLSEESENNRKILQELDVEVVALGNSEHLEAALDAIVASSSVIVDALFGTGLTRPLTGVFRTIIETINNSARPVLAVDIPSGINADTGEIMGTAMRAVRTATFGYPKPGHLSYPGYEYAGELSLLDIGLPSFGEPLLCKLRDEAGLGPDTGPFIYVTTCGSIQSVLPYRPINSHKGTFGNLLTIAGSLGMSGSGYLAAESALRIGAGLSYLATPRSLIGALPAAEVVYRPLSETTQQSIAQDALPEITKLLDTAKAVVLGPGLSQNPDTVAMVLALTELINQPCVIDADGLNALSQKGPQAIKLGRNFVLTPHPKELSRLTGKSVDDLLADRVKATASAAEAFDCTVVLKGAFSVIANSEGEVFFNPTGNSAMSTAGAGDVLSGVIGGLLAQGLSPFDAACAGVYLHGLAGDLAAQAIGATGIVASDIKEGLPGALTAVAAGHLSYLEEKLFQFVTAI